MPYGVKQDGEEYLLTNNVDQLDVEVSLYDEATDSHPHDGDETDITTEPSNLSRETATLTVELTGSHWEFSSDSTVTFAVTDVSGEVDAYFLFEPNSATLLATADLLDQDGNSRRSDLGELDELAIDPGVGGGFVDGGS